MIWDPETNRWSPQKDTPMLARIQGTQLPLDPIPRSFPNVQMIALPRSPINAPHQPLSPIPRTPEQIQNQTAAQSPTQTQTARWPSLSGPHPRPPATSTFLLNTPLPPIPTNGSPTTSSASPPPLPPIYPTRAPPHQQAIPALTPLSPSASQEHPPLHLPMGTLLSSPNPTSHQPQSPHLLPTAPTHTSPSPRSPHRLPPIAAVAAPPSPTLSPRISMAMRLQAILDAAKAKSPARPVVPRPADYDQRSPSNKRNWRKNHEN